ncbi:MAG: adenylyl-sulfate kinase, partial [Firmicutes bacterium]|nr:adenylyl-sulfate kinase [Bacillota bacterium]
EQSLIMDSKVGSRGGDIDYSLLLDGLMAEREEGITIDVAYRYFTTEKRSFIVADTPGHTEYTRNMAVGASFADLAVILVDASKGILTQTRRHARISAMMGVRSYVFALNKMDLVDYDQNRFKEVAHDIKVLAAEFDLDDVKIIPVSATEGDNITVRSQNMPWYKGETLLGWLEQVDVNKGHDEEGFIMPVQRVCRPDRSFRGYAGQIESGEIHIGDTVKVLPGDNTAKVSRILAPDHDSDEAGTGMPVTICLDKEIDVSRGSMLVKDTEVSVSRIFSAEILWMDDEPLVEGRSYLLKLGTQRIPATVMRVECMIDVNTGERVPAKKITKNTIADVDIALPKGIVLDSFSRHRSIGEFILIDRVSHMTSACGTVRYSLRRSENVTWQDLEVTRDLRAASLSQKPKTIWFTGLSGSGKSTLANAVEKRLHVAGKHTMMLDGDNIRMGINSDLGFTERDRIENIRRISEIAHLMNDAGLIVIASLISPFAADRRHAREIIGEGDFIEVYVSTPIEKCRERDVKGLYKKAENGEIPNFTGVNSPYEVPESPEITI